MNSVVLWGILIPFIGTSLGAACVFIMKRDFHPNVQKGLTGFAAGVMVAASIWSLLIPAMEDSSHLGKLAFLPAFAGFLTGDVNITAGAALDLSLGIALQNFPEGAIISLPLHSKGQSKGKAVLNGVLSGAVEPLGALLMIFFAPIFAPYMPIFLSFAAGAMLYVVVEELIPEMSEGKHSNIGVLLFALGFTVMMALDVALS